VYHGCHHLWWAQGWFCLRALHGLHSRCVLGSAMGELRSIGLFGTALDMVGTACDGFLAGVVFLDGWGTQFTS